MQALFPGWGNNRLPPVWGGTGGVAGFRLQGAGGSCVGLSARHDSASHLLLSPRKSETLFQTCPHHDFHSGFYFFNHTWMELLFSLGCNLCVLGGGC